MRVGVRGRGDSTQGSALESRPGALARIDTLLPTRKVDAIGVTESTQQNELLITRHPMYSAAR